MLAPPPHPLPASVLYESFRIREEWGIVKLVLMSVSVLFMTTCLFFLSPFSWFDRSNIFLLLLMLEPFPDTAPSRLDQRVQLRHERDEPHQVAADERDD